MTGRRTAGSMQDGSQGVAKLPEIAATNEGPDIRADGSATLLLPTTALSESDSLWI